MNNREIEEITQISYSTWYGHSSSHNPNTMLVKVLERIGKDQLLKYYQEMIEEEQLVIKTKKELEDELLKSYFSSNYEHLEFLTFPFNSTSKLYDIGITDKSTGKRYAISFKPIMQYGEKHSKLMRELIRDGQKEFGNFELIIITFKVYTETINKYFEGINVQYIGDLLGIDEDKLIILPKSRGKGVKVYDYE